MAATLANLEAATVRKILAEVEAGALIAMFPDTLSEVVAKIIADTLTCVEAAAPVKTDLDTLTGSLVFPIAGQE